MSRQSQHLKSKRSTITRGGWTPTGTAAERRANVDAAPSAKASVTRTRLLDAARVSFARLGYVPTTVDHIVTEAGLARGSFYTYFESKTDIFRHLAASIEQQIERDVVSFDRSAAGDHIAKLHTSNRNYLEVVRINADLYRLVDEVAAHDATVAKARLRSRQQHIARVATSIRRWQTEGRADTGIDPHITAAALVSMLSGFAQWLVGGDAYDHDYAATTVTDIWVRACGLTDTTRGSTT
jgi:AcrR family transcriptional regulator